MSLKNKICLVTGASRGIGKGIAVQLGEAGATVYITGRSASPRSKEVGGNLQQTADEINARGGTAVPVVCDHSNDKDVEDLFDKITKDSGRLDILVNNAYSGVHDLFQEVTSSRKFWQYEGPPAKLWDSINCVGLRNHFICSSYAAKLMVEAKSGLIINISSAGGIRYIFNVPYGVGKAAVDRMISDMAVELKSSNVTCLSLYPGAVLTEEIQAALNEDTEHTSAIKAIFAQGETPEFSGRAIVALAKDPNIHSRTGRILISADVAQEYGFNDINGRHPSSFRQLNYLLKSAGHTWLAMFVPNFIKVPGILVTMGAIKL